ncbi:GDYXXLXY domain-containing protein [Candidatus Ichthyocystis hellenicum]|uniref:GDYXXLXY domain-containing protein n=1 Tax=Candidatus Ichthyocystis hellenicum TaxID=1561003 RepID=UPI001585CE84|nr:GDYXXLXY domain-containing protein [Candidatus Ichthyocystis hellenicum]
MNAKIMIIWLIIVIMFLNYAIYAKEKIRNSGENVFLEISPEGYRSIIKGYYIRLRYDIEKKIPYKYVSSSPDRGYIVVSVGNNKVAHFARMYAGEVLSPSERLIRFHKNKNKYSISIVPSSFFVQETSVEAYKNSRYAIFKFGKSGEYILVKLADKDKRAINFS